jgi:hypothetical protein
MPMSRVAFHSTMDPSWSAMEPVRLGAVPRGGGTPDQVVIVEADGRPLLRVDLYRSGKECFAFQEVQLWRGLVALGWGHSLYLIAPEPRNVSAIALGGYFGHLYSSSDYLLAASAEQLFRIEPGGLVVWSSAQLGIDGVIVERIAWNLIEGRGEWDPPDGWRAFRVCLESGRSLGSG